MGRRMHEDGHKRARKGGATDRVGMAGPGRNGRTGRRTKGVVMEYRTLGGTGTVVSTYCLGTMTFGNETSEEVAHAQLDRFVAAGGNFLDTANVYSRGTSESI